MEVKHREIKDKDFINSPSNKISVHKKDIPNEDFDCNPNGDCWCKQESFPQLPIISRDKCLSPQQIQEIRDNRDTSHKTTNSNSEILKAPNFEVK